MREAVEQCGGTDRSPEYSNAGMNWENVNKGVVARIGCQVLTQAFATTTDMLNAA